MTNSQKNVTKFEPIYKEKYLTTKIKSDKGKISSNFYDNKLPKEGSQCICLSVILIDSVFGIGKKYYTQVFSEEYRYVAKEKKMPKYIDEGVDIYSDGENSDEEHSDKENPDEETYSTE